MEPSDTDTKARGESREYPLREAEAKWQRFWEEEKLYHFDPGGAAPVFSIDTPPPTVSGQLHVGHVYSYTQAEIIARYMRMRGRNVFYPFGFDDNGLPTERLVERELGIRGSAMPRAEFIGKCLEVSARHEKSFRELWRGLGFSAEWDRLYSTIDPRSRRASQRSFLDLYRRGLAYRRSEPTLFCPGCRTTVAQAEAEDRVLASRFLTIRFGLPGGGILPVATTRPELLPALAAIFVHPGDARYANLIGTAARDPLFGIEAPIIGDEGADPAKGSGAVMCCAFGDAADVDWFRKHDLRPRLAIGPDGLMGGSAGSYAGLGVREARSRVSADLLARGLAEEGPALEHSVNVHERCGTELELVLAEEWFIRILDRKEELERLAFDIEWRPPHMRERYLDWVRNLRWDWCVSRQRSFGVPFPLWYCSSCGAVKIAEESELPVDPAASPPSSPCACGSSDFAPEPDVMDTWATSSVSPQINARWGEEGDLMDRIFPFSLRPQAHDIIRTWAFYTIAKSAFHHGEAPWREIMISGHSRDPAGNKISKSKGNAGASPFELLERHGADPLRYWAASAGLGTDSAFSEKTVAEGRKLVLKLWNASLLAEPFIAGGAAPGNGASRDTVDPVERWIAAAYRRAARTATAALDARDYDAALAAAETFFRRDFCDDYLELCKPLARPGGPGSPRGAAAMGEVLYGAVRLFAPFLPHIAEEIYQRLFRAGEGHRSVHVAPWPEPGADGEYEEALVFGECLSSLLEALRRAKTEARLSMAAPVAALAWSLDRSGLPGGFGERVAADLAAAMPRVAAALRIVEWREAPPRELSGSHNARLDGSRGAEGCRGALALRIDWP